MSRFCNMIVLRFLVWSGQFAFPSPSGAQVATVAVFGPMTEPVTEVENGVAGTRSADFALYDVGEAGRYSASARMAAQAELARPAFGVAGARLTSLNSLPATPPTRCAPIGSAPPRLLALTVSLARRAFWPTIAMAECRFGLPAGLLDSVVLAESRYDTHVVSPAGAVGLAQLMPDTALQLGVFDRFDPAANIFGGARYLRTLIDCFRGDVPMALAAYNAGPGTVRRLGRIPLNHETPGYVHRVLSYWTAPGIGSTNAPLPARQTAELLGFAPTITR